MHVHKYVSIDAEAVNFHSLPGVLLTADTSHHDESTRGLSSLYGVGRRLVILSPYFRLFCSDIYTKGSS
jgi:hypothetical protein